jgi:hypothetical protein
VRKNRRKISKRILKYNDKEMQVKKKKRRKPRGKRER